MSGDGTMQKNNRVTAGCAAALTHATAACIAGANPEKMQRVPSLAGMSSEVIIPKHSRNVYDHAVRMLGVTIVEVDSAAPPFRERLIRGNRATLVVVSSFLKLTLSVRIIVVIQNRFTATTPAKIEIRSTQICGGSTGTRRGELRSYNGCFAA